MTPTEPGPRDADRGFLGPRLVAAFLVGLAALLIVSALGISRGAGYTVVGPQTIGASGREPGDLAHQPRGQAQAIGHEGPAMAIVAALRRSGIEQLARHVGMRDLAGVLVF